MYWYDPTSHASEWVAAPSNDDEAVRMLADRPDSARLVSEYAELRRSGAPVERTLVLVGHEERPREHDLAPMRLAWRERPRVRAPGGDVPQRRARGSPRAASLLGEGMSDLLRKNLREPPRREVQRTSFAGRSNGAPSGGTHLYGRNLISFKGNPHHLALR